MARDVTKLYILPSVLLRCAHNYSLFFLIVVVVCHYALKIDQINAGFMRIVSKKKKNRRDKLAENEDKYIIRLDESNNSNKKSCSPTFVNFDMNERTLEMSSERDFINSFYLNIIQNRAKAQHLIPIKSVTSTWPITQSTHFIHTQTQRNQ